MNERSGIRSCLKSLTRSSASSFGPVGLVAESAGGTQPTPEWMDDDAIQGLGIGEKIRNGEPTGQLALRVYVNEKRPLSEIAVPVPSSVDEGGTQAVTDVIAIGQLEPEVFSDRVRPLVAGAGISLGENEPGTLGCFVELSDGRIAILSNAHVIADYGRSALGAKVCQPAHRDASPSNASDSVASLSDVKQFAFSTRGFENVVDAAVAALDVPIENIIREFAQPPRSINIRPRVGMRVQKVGRTTGRTWGTITDTDFSGQLLYPGPSGTRQRVGFRDQVLCTRYTEGGDSGSLVMSSTGRALGLHFAGSPEVSVFNRIAHVERELDVRLLTVD